MQAANSSVQTVVGLDPEYLRERVRQIFNYLLQQKADGPTRLLTKSGAPIYIDYNDNQASVRFRSAGLEFNLSDPNCLTGYEYNLDKKQSNAVVALSIVLTDNSGECKTKEDLICLINIRIKSRLRSNRKRFRPRLVQGDLTQTDCLGIPGCGDAFIINAETGRLMSIVDPADEANQGAHYRDVDLAKCNRDTLDYILSDILSLNSLNI